MHDFVAIWNDSLSWKNKAGHIVFVQDVPIVSPPCFLSISFIPWLYSEKMALMVDSQAFDKEVIQYEVWQHWDTLIWIPVYTYVCFDIHAK